MRYGLRSLFVVLTALCCGLGYLAYGLNWVRERQQFIEANDRIFFELAGRRHPARHESALLTLCGGWHVAAVYVTVPTIEVHADGLETPVPDVSETVPRIKRLFPEAEVVEFPYRVRR